MPVAGNFNMKTISAVEPKGFVLWIDEGFAFTFGTMHYKMSGKISEGHTWVGKSFFAHNSSTLVMLLKVF